MKPFSIKYLNDIYHGYKGGFVKKCWHVGVKRLVEDTILKNKANLERFGQLMKFYVFKVPQFDELSTFFSSKVSLLVDIIQCKCQNAKNQNAKCQNLI